MSKASVRAHGRDGERQGDPPASAPDRPTWTIAGRRIFGFDPRPSKPVMDHAVRQTALDFPDSFQDLHEIRQLLARICLPASRRWAFVVTGKAATTTTLSLLFEAEFGVPFTVRARWRNDPNAHPAAHALMWHGVFATALDMPRTLRDLGDDARLERVVVVRHPEARAASAFDYICRSNEQESWDFFPERARMAALVGFNFDTMSGTSSGFVRFLECVAADLATNPAHSVNPHWRPQARLIFPQLFRPTLTGRVEAYEQFRRELFSRLDRPLPHAPLRLNASEPDLDNRADLFRDPAARRLIRDIYADDFHQFGYEPGSC